jgi:single-strand DNA-binding protein
MDCNATITGNMGSGVGFKSGETNGRKWARAEFRVGSTRRIRRADGVWADAGTTWITVEAWSTLADGVRGSLDKGDPVIITGRLRTDEWHDANGQQQSRLVMVADSVGHDLSRGRTRFTRNVPLPAPEEAKPAESGQADDTRPLSVVRPPSEQMDEPEPADVEPTEEYEPISDEFDQVAVG